MVRRTRFHDHDNLFVSPDWCPELKGAAELLLKCFRRLLLGRGVVTWESVSQTLSFCFLASSCAVLTLWISKASLALVVTLAFSVRRFLVSLFYKKN